MNDSKIYKIDERTFKELKLAALNSYFCYGHQVDQWQEKLNYFLERDSEDDYMLRLAHLKYLQNCQKYFSDLVSKINYIESLTDKEEKEQQYLKDKAKGNLPHLKQKTNDFNEEFAKACMEF